MAAVMTKRERVERTMALQETDRVPIYDILLNDDAFEHFSGEKLPPIVPQASQRERGGAIGSEPDAGEVAEETQRSLERIVGKAINRFLDMTRSVGFGPMVEKDFTDELGFVIHQAPHEKTSWITQRPFDDDNGAAEFIKRWISKTRGETDDIRADPGAYRERYHRRFLEAQARIGDTVNLLAVQGVGLDEVRHRLGMEVFAYLESDQPGLISEFMEAYTQYNLAVCHAIADLTLSPLVLTYGDIACKGRLLHSPAYLRREFFPRLERLQDAWHEHGFKCLFHSDGYLMEVMDDLIESGIDGLNPIEVVAGMNLAEIKARYGRKLFLTGAIDMSQLLHRASPAQVREVCREAIRVAYPGYFIGSTTESDNSVKLENLVAMYEVAMEGV